MHVAISYFVVLDTMAGSSVTDRVFVGVRVTASGQITPARLSLLHE